MCEPSVAFLASEGIQTYEMVVAPIGKNPPFPSPLDDSRSVLAVKGSLRRFAPWTAPGRFEGMTVYEGKGGMQIKPVIYLI